MCSDVCPCKNPALTDEDGVRIDPSIQFRQISEADLYVYGRTNYNINGYKKLNFYNSPATKSYWTFEECLDDAIETEKAINNTHDLTDVFGQTEYNPDINNTDMNQFEVVDESNLA